MISFSQAVIAEMVAVVGEVDENGAVVEARAAEIIHYLANLVIEQAHFGVVGADETSHLLCRARRSARQGGLVTVTKVELAGQPLIQHAQSLGLFAKVGIELDIDMGIAIEIFLRCGQRQMRVMRREPE